MTIQEYIDKINILYRTGNAREHSYRGDLQTLLMTILPDVLVTNEPARVDCGAPDYMLTRKDVPIGYIEAKDIGVDLASKTLKEQFERYKSGLTNLIFTDYLEFHFYKEGQFMTKIAIAKVDNGSIVSMSENFNQFFELIKNFALTVSQTIKSPTKLAQMMAGKAKLMADVIEKSLNHDDETETRTPLKNQMLSFQKMLIHDIDNKTFSDIYAQTIAYGMFAARYHDPTLPTFSRLEAAQLIPRSNPFLRKLFQDIAGFDVDSRIVWMVDELVNIFLASDVAQIMKNFGKSTKQEDPVVHFYETFLAEYNPALRKSRGVWYTPQPVVNFIVRAVDDILKSEFNLSQGLADTSKTKIKVDYLGKKIEKEVHKVQILDPATGTGTFLAETVKHIYKKFESQQGIWSKYVTNDLIPRLNGFELLMASYAMAHLKMDMLLSETGYKSDKDQRFKIFLTNSLEEAHKDTGTLFSALLSDESDQANEIKRETPVMCVIGNPPYSVSSSNKSEWIEGLTADYKKNLKERNIQPLSDDYIKFIRFGQYFIEKNGEGILAYISNNSFIDGIIHRQMRKSLLECFDKMYILDLHGSAKKKEVSPDGSVDQNVFDIMQGVSINIFIKTSKKKKSTLAEVFHLDLHGKREYKYDFLAKHSIASAKWNRLECKKPNYYFVNKNFEGENEYEMGFRIDELFDTFASGLTTERDSLTIHFDESTLKSILEDFKTLEPEEVRKKHSEKPDGRDWKMITAKQDVASNHGSVCSISYRPFDLRKTYYTGKTKGFMAYPRNEVMKHLIDNNNIGLIAKRGFDNDKSAVGFITKYIADRRGWSSPGMQGAENVFPLYLNNDSTQFTTDGNQTRKPNFSSKVIDKISKNLGLRFSNEQEKNTQTYAPIDLLDYIYAILHSPRYHEKYKEFLKIDFPRVPAPQDRETFWKLVKLGGELRQIHLLESPVLEQNHIGYPEDGNNVVAKPTFKDGCVYINDTQYFSNVTEVAWGFYIGGYQPAQKWLKDRKNLELSYDDIRHYQKMIIALSETDRLMKEIDKIEI
jgi:predicted helicase